MRSRGLAALAVVATGVFGCTGGSSPSHQADPPRPTHTGGRAASGPGVAPADQASADGAQPLFGIGDEGSFSWRCDGRATDVTLVDPEPSATESVQVRVGSRVVLKRVVQPGQQVKLSMPVATTARWTVTQSTEPRTLSATVLVTTRAGRCLTYLPPEVRARLRTTSHSSA